MIPEPIKSILPPQQTGKASDITSDVVLDPHTTPAEAFAKVSDRLLNVNCWHQYAGKGTAAFQLTDAEGQPVNRKAEVGDYFQIDIPGPGPRRGKGKDWVRIEDLQCRSDSLCFFTVRPAAPPWQKNSETVHFFAPSSSSTFVVFLNDHKLMAGVFGRNEKPNVHTSGWLDRLRHLLVAVGAWLGFSYVQWKALTAGLIRNLKH